MKSLIKNVTFIILILSFILLFYVNVPKINLPFNSSKIEIYLNNGSHGKIKTEKRKSAIFNLNKKGEAYEIDENLDVQKIIDFYDAKVVFLEDSEWGLSVFAYSKKIKYEKTIKGKKINLQVNVNKTKGQTKIGFPMIYGSF